MKLRNESAGGPTLVVKTCGEFNVGTPTCWSPFRCDHYVVLSDRAWHSSLILLLIKTVDLDPSYFYNFHKKSYEGEVYKPHLLNMSCLAILFFQSRHILLSLLKSTLNIRGKLDKTHRYLQRMWESRGNVWTIEVFKKNYIFNKFLEENFPLG